jgi:isocitrate/isopropylmalate dehydrogenase
VANPLAAISSMAMMLRHIDEPEAAIRVERAVERAVAERRLTRDLGGELSTSGCGHFVAEAVARSA